MTMKILQIGYLNWASQVEKLPEDLEWFFCKPENIQNFLKLEEEKLLAEFLKDMTKQDNLIEKPKIHIHFNAIVITDYLEEIQLEPLIDTIEAYSLFCEEKYFVNWKNRKTFLLVSIFYIKYCLVVNMGQS